MFQSNMTYHITFLSSLILYPIILALFVFIAGYGLGTSYLLFIFIITASLTSGLIPALITSLISIKLKNTFVQKNSNLNLIKIKWLSYTVISGIIVSIIMPSIIFCFGDEGARLVALLLLLVLGVSGFSCTLLACAILLYKGRHFKL